jgi:hypothetical protein
MLRHIMAVSQTNRQTSPSEPQKILLALISVRDWVDSRTIVPSVVRSRWKIPITWLGIETVTFRVVDQCLNQMHYSEHHNYTGIFFHFTKHIHLIRRSISCCFICCSKAKSLQKHTIYCGCQLLVLYRGQNRLIKHKNGALTEWY